MSAHEFGTLLGTVTNTINVGIERNVNTILRSAAALFSMQEAGHSSTRRTYSVPKTNNVLVSIQNTPSNVSAIRTVRKESMDHGSATSSHSIVEVEEITEYDEPKCFQLVDSAKTGSVKTDSVNIVEDEQVSVKLDTVFQEPSDEDDDDNSHPVGCPCGVCERLKIHSTAQVQEKFIANKGEHSVDENIITVLTESSGHKSEKTESPTPDLDTQLKFAEDVPDDSSVESLTIVESDHSVHVEEASMNSNTVIPLFVVGPKNSQSTDSGKHFKVT